MHLRPFLFLLAYSVATVSYGQGDLLERGTYLMNSVMACGNCHTPKTADGAPIPSMHLAGSFVIEEPGLKAYAPNITMDLATGIGSWTDEEIIRAIRDGNRPDGTIVGPPMPNLWYRNMSDRDVRAIVAYLRTVEPVNSVVPKSVYEIPLPPAWGPPVGVVPDVSRDDPEAYATYVAVALGHCTECHTPLVEGMHDFSRIGQGGNVYHNLFGTGHTVISADITPSRLGSWSDEEIKRAFTQGISRDGREHLPGMAYPYYENISDEDLDALVRYLRSLPPRASE